MRTRCRRDEVAAEQLQRLHEPRGQARRDHAERDGGGVLDLRDHQVLEGVREEHPGVVATELWLACRPPGRRHRTIAVRFVT